MCYDLNENLLFWVAPLHGHTHRYIYILYISVCVFDDLMQTGINLGGKDSENHIQIPGSLSGFDTSTMKDPILLGFCQVPCCGNFSF